MKKPIKPTKPRKPTKPKPPEPPKKRIITSNSLKNIAYFDDSIYKKITKEELVNSMPDGSYLLLKVDFTQDNHYYDYGDAYLDGSLDVHTDEEIDNPKYTTELARYNRNLKSHAKKLEKYNEKMKLYNTKLETYKIEFAKYEEEFSRYLLERHEKEINHLEKERAKLEKELKAKKAL